MWRGWLRWWRPFQAGGGPNDCCSPPGCSHAGCTVLCRDATGGWGRGGREVAKWVRIGKARAVLVAPNIEPAEGEAGLSALLDAILSNARKHSIPVIFALSRKRMGQVPPQPHAPKRAPTPACCHDASPSSSMALRPGAAVEKRVQGVYLHCADDSSRQRGRPGLRRPPHQPALTGQCCLRHPTTACRSSAGPRK